jgi:hypothetical protein
MPEAKAKTKPKIADKSDNGLPWRSGLLDGKKEISNFLCGASDYKLNKWVKSGMPVLIEDGCWSAHVKNIEDFFKERTRVDSRNKISLNSDD